MSIAPDDLGMHREPELIYVLFLAATLQFAPPPVIDIGARAQASTQVC